VGDFRYVTATGSPPYWKEDGRGGKRKEYHRVSEIKFAVVSLFLTALNSAGISLHSSLSNLGCFFSSSSSKSFVRFGLIRIVESHRTIARRVVRKT
jgi:hypothetical protein